MNAAQRLASDDALRGACAAAGRRYADTAFDIEAITDRFEAVLSRRANPSGVPARDVAAD